MDIFQNLIKVVRNNFGHITQFAATALSGASGPLTAVNTALSVLSSISRAIMDSPTTVRPLTSATPTAIKRMSSDVRTLNDEFRSMFEPLAKIVSKLSLLGIKTYKDAQSYSGSDIQILSLIESLDKVMNTGLLSVMNTSKSETLHMLDESDIKMYRDCTELFQRYGKEIIGDASNILEKWNVNRHLADTISVADVQVWELDESKSIYSLYKTFSGVPNDMGFAEDTTYITQVGLGAGSTQLSTFSHVTGNYLVEEIFTTTDGYVYPTFPPKQQCYDWWAFTVVDLDLQFIGNPNVVTGGSTMIVHIIVDDEEIEKYPISYSDIIVDHFSIPLIIRSKLTSNSRKIDFWFETLAVAAVTVGWNLREKRIDGHLKRTLCMTEEVEYFRDGRLEYLSEGMSKLSLVGKLDKPPTYSDPNVNASRTLFALDETNIWERAWSGIKRLMSDFPSFQQKYTSKGVTDFDKLGDMESWEFVDGPFSGMNERSIVEVMGMLDDDVGIAKQVYDQDNLMIEFVGDS
jgi:hypothetical protein